MSPSNETLYLGFGGALTAFGLIFAVYQLRTPQWDLVLRIRNSWQRNLFWILGVIGLILVLLRVLIAELSIDCIPPFIFEIAAYLFFIASPLSLILLSTRTKGLFCKTKAIHFYRELVHEISKSTESNTNAAIEVLLDNFRTICESAKRSDDSDESSAARAVLDVVLSDESVVKQLTTKRLDDLHFVFMMIEEKRIDRTISYIGIEKIFSNLFYDKNSFFFKHLQGEGLALSSNIYDSIFSKPSILSNFNVFDFGVLRYSRREYLDLTGVEVFIEALKRTIKTYITTDAVPPIHINDGLSYLSDIFKDQCLKIRTEEKRGTDIEYFLKDEREILCRIGRFFRTDFLYIDLEGQVKASVVKKENKVDDPDFHSTETINAGIAAAIYKAFEHLSYIEKTYNWEWQLILDLMGVMNRDNQIMEGYRPPFEKRIWQQIATNVKRREYPAVLRIYLTYIGFHAASGQPHRNEWLNEQTEKIKRLLYIDLKPLLDEKALMINKKPIEEALLPDRMEYKNGVFTYKYGFNRDYENEIAKPPEDLESAMKDIETESETLP